MTPTVLALLAAFLGGGGIGGLIKVFLDHRRARTDEAQVITSAAAEYVGVVRDEMQSLRQRMEKVESRLLSTQRSARALSRWSQRAYKELLTLEVDIEPPPDIEHLGDEGD